jgi:disulfide bond formation protein DsbB
VGRLSGAQIAVARLFCRTNTRITTGITLLKFVHSLTVQRWPWLLLTVAAIVLECFALYIQHALGVEPCNECIYVRVGVLGIGVAGLIGVIAPRLLVLRSSALSVWLLSLGWSLYRANLLLDLEQKVRDGAEAGCGRFKGFPEWIPLDRWLPDMFEPRAMCGAVSWTFLNQSVTFWIWTALWVFALAAITVLVAQTRPAD